MNCNPLAYDSLKSVLLRMDPNMRIKLSNRIPGIRTAERSVPLFIDILYLAPNRTNINNNLYVVRCEQSNPLILSEWQRDVISHRTESEVSFDLTCYGICDHTADDRILPGDVELKGVEYQLEREQTEHALNLLDEIRERQSIDLAYSPGTYLVFNNNSKDQLILTETLEYNRSVVDAAKYVNDKLLGGRHHAIRVKQLFNEDGVLRLPVGMKLKVKYWTMKFNVQEVHNSFKGILDEGTFPLKRLHFENNIISQQENYLHKIVREAKYLQIECREQHANWLNVVLKVKNLEAHFECDNSKEDLHTVLNDWIRDGREIGTFFSFGIGKKEDVAFFFEESQKLKNSIVEQITGLGCPTFPDAVIIPLKTNSDIIIACLEEDEDLNRFTRWMLSITVNVKNHRHLWNVDYDDDVFQ